MVANTAVYVHLLCGGVERGAFQSASEEGVIHPPTIPPQFGHSDDEKYNMQ